MGSGPSGGHREIAWTPVGPGAAPRRPHARTGPGVGGTPGPGADGNVHLQGV